MPEVEVNIGGRSFAVACQEGEEVYLKAAARLLDTEATALSAQIGRLPENRMLLMAGLMLADKAAGVDEQLRGLEERVQLAERRALAAEEEAEALRNAPPPPAERIQVPVVPDGLRDSMAEIAARAESLADEIEEKAEA
ncbi:cell division protein ZapA [Anianabacter salinae]|uniref:cell division protein ZapA n=1 Tax=Anianabacter salinae TaxID=2851023 RepID=UPI00225E40CF|nr:cell division protein ZapA [Anianabacter salinae]MBV0911536.1 cell division protein ZapA [Anianabacter salinae]